MVAKEYMDYEGMLFQFVHPIFEIGVVGGSIVRELEFGLGTTFSAPFIGDANSNLPWPLPGTAWPRR